MNNIGFNAKSESCYHVCWKLQLGFILADFYFIWMFQLSMKFDKRKLSQILSTDDTRFVFDIKIFWKNKKKNRQNFNLTLNNKVLKGT